MSDWTVVQKIAATFVSVVAALGLLWGGFRWGVHVTDTLAVIPSLQKAQSELIILQAARQDSINRELRILAKFVCRTIGPNDVVDLDCSH